MGIGTVRKVDINPEVQEAYLDYAMSMIVSRALPNVRDGDYVLTLTESGYVRRTPVRSVPKK